MLREAQLLQEEAEIHDLGRRHRLAAVQDAHAVQLDAAVLLVEGLVRGTQVDIG